MAAICCALPDPLKENRRRALYGMPERLFGRYLARLLGLGRSVLVVRQGEQQWTGVRERVLVWRMVPVGLPVHPRAQVLLPRCLGTVVDC